MRASWQANWTASLVTARKARCLYGLFSDAIEWDGRAEFVTDGQHHLRALRYARVPYIMAAR